MPSFWHPERNVFKRFYFCPDNIIIWKQGGGRATWKDHSDMKTVIMTSVQYKPQHVPLRPSNNSDDGFALHFAPYEVPPTFSFIKDYLGGFLFDPKIDRCNLSIHPSLPEGTRAHQRERLHERDRDRESTYSPLPQQDVVMLLFFLHSPTPSGFGKHMYTCLACFPSCWGQDSVIGELAPKAQCTAAAQEATPSLFFSRKSSNRAKQLLTAHSTQRATYESPSFLPFSSSPFKLEAM